MPGLTAGGGQAAKPLALRWAVSLDDHCSALAWSRDGGLVAAAALGGPVHVLDSVTGERRALLGGHAFGTVAAAWHPREALLATGGQDGKVRWWDPATATCTVEADAGADWVEALAWSRDGDWLATAAGKSVRFWTRDGSLVRECASHASTVTDVAWHPAAPLLASACYGGVTFWSPGGSGAPKRLDWKGSVLALAWSPDARMLASGNQDASVHFWYVESGEDMEMAGYPKKVRELSWSADSRLLATGGSADVVVWDCSGKGPAGREPLELRQHAAAVTQVSFQPRGQLLASADADGMLALWRPGKSGRPRGVASLEGAATRVAWSNDGKQLVCATDTGAVAAYAIPRPS